jgi:hypothetical protein
MSATMTIRVSEETLAKLTKIAEGTKRSKSFLAGERSWPMSGASLPLLKASSKQI